MTSNRNERALSRIVEEVRSEPRPEIDWQRVETALQAKLSSGTDARYALTRERRSLFRVAAMAATIVGCTLVTAEYLLDHAQQAEQGVTSNPPVIDPAEQAPSFVDGNALPEGSVVTAGPRPSTVKHAGRAQWTLSPGSVAKMERASESIVIALERGSIVADVVPGKVPGRFAVHAGNTRVSVEGTVFRVERIGEAVLVNVSRGTVSVGPAAGVGPVTRLSAPEWARFDLTGRRELAAVTPTPTSPAKPSLRPLPPDTVDNSSAAPEPPSEPNEAAAASKGAPATAGDLSQAAATARSIVQQCFADNTPPRGDIRISAQTQMRMDVREDGRVDLVEFQPPLAPAVETCVGERFARVRLSAPSGGTRLEQSVVLER